MRNLIFLHLPGGKIRMISSNFCSSVPELVFGLVLQVSYMPNKGHQKAQKEYPLLIHLYISPCLEIYREVNVLCILKYSEVISALFCCKLQV